MTKRRMLPQYDLILSDDNHLPRPKVRQALTELLHIQDVSAHELTEVAREHGSCVIHSTHQERAELFMDQFKEKGITVAIRPTTPTKS